MSTPDQVQQYGRITVYPQGISRRPILFIFGQPFDLAWPDISAWAVTEQSIQHANTAKPKLERILLELYSAGKVHYIIRPTDNPEITRIICAVKTALPDKEIQSYLTHYKNL